MGIYYSSPNVGIVIISKSSLQVFTSVGCVLLEKGIHCSWFNRKSWVQVLELWSKNWQFLCLTKGKCVIFRRLWCYLNEKACNDLAPGTDESDENASLNSWAKSTSEPQLERTKTLGSNIVIGFVGLFFRFVINSAHISVSATAVLYVFSFSRQACLYWRLLDFDTVSCCGLTPKLWRNTFPLFFFKKVRNPVQLDAWAIKTGSELSICRDVDCLFGLMTRA